ncbi:17629_t:CDS:2, partial [Funneliformis geosporum]
MPSVNTVFIPFISSCIFELSCSVCQKSFKKSSGLSRHLGIVNKYNITRNDLDSLSETNNTKFKKYSSVFDSPTEHQFFDVFKGHIYYRRKFYNEEQQTYVILFDDLLQHLKKNPLTITTYVAENFNKRRRSKYNPGEVIVEWKIKVEKDAKENY